MGTASRHKKVFTALVWLKENNFLYKDIVLPMHYENLLDKIKDSQIVFENENNDLDSDNDNENDDENDQYTNKTISKSETCYVNTKVPNR